ARPLSERGADALVEPRADAGGAARRAARRRRRRSLPVLAGGGDDPRPDGRRRRRLLAPRLSRVADRRESGGVGAALPAPRGAGSLAARGGARAPTEARGQARAPSPLRRR